MTVVNRDHPITRGIPDWRIADEVYTINSSEPVGDCDLLMTTDHPKSMRALAWTRRHGRSRVLCFRPGHDRVAWLNPVFLDVLGRGVRWAAGDL